MCLTYCTRFTYGSILKKRMKIRKLNLCISVKWVTVRYTDGVINLVEGRHIENVDTGESMIEADSLKVGDDCSARYGDGHMYPAEILHVTGIYHTSNCYFPRHGEAIGGGGGRHRNVGRLCVRPSQSF